VNITEMYPRIPWIRSWIAWNPWSTLLPVILVSSPDHRYAGRCKLRLTELIVKLLEFERNIYWSMGWR